MSLITITRDIGCGGMTIARKVANELKLELYDDHRLQEEAIEMGVSSEDLNSFGKGAPGLFDRLLSHKPEIYLDLMGAVVYEIAHRGQGVILGHGAYWLLKEFGCALQVRIYSSEGSRVEHLMNQRGMSSNAAEKIIHKSDNEKRGFLQFFFRMDWNDISLYDLIINRDKLGVESAARLITEVAQSQQIKACSLEALEKMGRLSLLKKVEAAILKERIDSQDLHIEIPGEGIVYIAGSINPLESESHLLEAVRGVPGVAEIRSEVVVPEIADI